VTFRRRIVVLTAAAVAAAVALASVTVYVVVRGQLRDQVDDRLRAQGENVGRIVSGIARIQAVGAFPAPTGAVPFQLPIDPLSGPVGAAQLVQADGDVLRARIGDDVAPSLPVDERTLAVARGEHPSYFRDTTVDGTHVRLYTTVAPIGALQLVRPLTEVDDTLGHLRVILLLVTIGGVGGAAGLGLVVARSALRPVQHLTDAAEHVARTQDLNLRIPAGGQDELSRLGGSFNTMLGALETSREAQVRLVADASHELRTPLTSIRTNVELLARTPGLEPADREQALAAATEQLEELSVLVGDLVDLARPGGPTAPGDGEERETLRLDLVVGEAVERARRLAPGCTFTVDALPCVVEGVRPQLHRALANLLDNAVKHGPAAGPVEVVVRDGEVVVRDHGPGIAAEDRPHVFDRFYRAAAARGLPGSGLGLAIVRQAAQDHAGTVDAEPASGGGTRLVLRLPVLAD